MEQGFSGRSLGAERETYHLRMQMVHLYDVMNSCSVDLSLSSEATELYQAKNLVAHIKKDCLVIYDRAYIDRNLMILHIESGSFFLIRLKKSGNSKGIDAFAIASNKKQGWVHLDGEAVKLFRCKSPSGDARYYATNADKILTTPSEADHLYRERWDVESSFKELVESLSLEQWHTKSYNGIMQELYARFWLYNFTKIQMLIHSGKLKRELGKSYERGNTKVAVEWVACNLARFWHRKRNRFSEFIDLLKKSTETRQRYKRFYERKLRHPGSPYVTQNTVWSFNGKWGFYP